MAIIAPSLLSADFLNLGTEIEMINRSQAQWIHFDVMDGVFVPNISFGFPILQSIRPITHKHIDVHLMIDRAPRYSTRFVEAGANSVSLHYENTNHLHRALSEINTAGALAGVAINPHNPVQLLFDILPYADFINLMSVNPGFGGQKFIDVTYRKVEALRNHIDSEGLKTKIQVDGGVDVSNYKKLIDLGADILVVGSAVFSSPQPQMAIDEMVVGV